MKSPALGGTSRCRRASAFTLCVKRRAKERGNEIVAGRGVGPGRHSCALGRLRHGRAAGRSEGRQGDDGKYLDAKGDPTYNVKPDGTVDWYTFSGYRRYHAECHVCHGPNGEGSTYAPALKDSVKRFNYAEFAGIVIGGRENKQAAMTASCRPSPTTRTSCAIIDDLYVYLRARSTDAIEPRPSGEEGRERPRPSPRPRPSA